jgi:hypothetical protein
VGRRGVPDVLSKFSSDPLISFMSTCHSSIIETGKLEDKKTEADPDSQNYSNEHCYFFWEIERISTHETHTYSYFFFMRTRSPMHESAFSPFLFLLFTSQFLINFSHFF